MGGGGEQLAEGGNCVTVNVDQIIEKVERVERDARMSCHISLVINDHVKKSLRTIFCFNF